MGVGYDMAHTDSAELISTANSITRLYLTANDVAVSRTMSVWYDANTTPLKQSTELFFPKQTQRLQLVEWQSDGALFTTVGGTSLTADNYIGIACVYVGGEEVLQTTTYTDSVGIFRLPMTISDDHIGESLVVVWKPADNATLANSEICLYVGTIPFRSNDNATMPTSADKVDVVVLAGTEYTITAPATYGTITINPTGKLTIAGSGALTMDTLIIRANGPQDQYAQLYVTNGVTLSTSTIYYDYELDNADMYTFAAPGEVSLSNLTFPIICEKLSGSSTTPTLETDYYIDYFDGDKHATSTNHKGFTYYTDQAGTLDAATGYTIAADPQLWGSTTRTSVTLRIPIAYNENLPSEDASLPIKKHGDDNTPAAHRGWNFVGSPFFCAMQKGGTMGGEELNYYTVPSNRGIYTQEPSDEFALTPFHAFFVQSENAGDLIFKPSQQQRPGERKILARYAEEKPSKHLVGISLSDGTDSDKTQMLISEKYGDTYEFNADLAKWEDARPVRLYTLLGTTKLAFNATSPELAKQPIPVGYRTAALGEMTFSALEKDANALYAALNLYDSKTQITTNLLYSDYTFTPDKTEDDSRFTLACIPLAKTPTDNESVASDAVRIAVGGSGITLYGVPADAVVRVYDVLGHLHYEGDGADAIALGKGAYLVQILSPTHSQTLKFVKE